EGPNSEKGKGPESSATEMNPPGGADGRRLAVKPNPGEHLLEQILSRPTMLKAFLLYKI
ncbi:MAG TPA: group II intron reverse transcriptase/maturase, partial [Desulfobacterales bacterium]|nr:group II intron reverse transcriptase/maturase [Desulfobacterales bacterium]